MVASIVLTIAVTIILFRVDVEKIGEGFHESPEQNVIIYIITRKSKAVDLELAPAREKD